MRFRQRHVHHTIYRHIDQGLSDLGWDGMDFGNGPIPPNFNASPVMILDYEPQQAGQTPAPNTVAVSIDHQGNDDPFELGGLQKCEYTLFIDIYGENESMAVAIGDDVKDLIVNQSMPVLDYTHESDGVATDLWLEFEDVIVEKIPAQGGLLDKRSWRAVKATVVCFF